MKRFFLTLSTLTFFLSSAYATTAVLCGNPAKVDQNNNFASVWLILDSNTPQASDEVRAIFSGREAKVTTVTRNSGQLTIRVAQPDRTVTIDESSIDSACDGETLFSVGLDSRTSHQTVSSCRCFED